MSANTNTRKSFTITKEMDAAIRRMSPATKAGMTFEQIVEHARKNQRAKTRRVMREIATARS